MQFWIFFLGFICWFYDALRSLHREVWATSVHSKEQTSLFRNSWAYNNCRVQSEHSEQSIFSSATLGPTITVECGGSRAFSLIP